MSAESREKAKRKGQKSGKGTELVSRTLKRIRDTVTGTDDDE